VVIKNHVVRVLSNERNGKLLIFLAPFYLDKISSADIILNNS